MYQRKITEENLCPFEYAMSIFKGKWDIRIICLLAHNTALRYGEFKEYLPDISDTALSGVLKKLTENQILIRKVYDELPARVEYSLAKRGKEAVPILQELCKWSAGSKNVHIVKKLMFCEDCKYGIEKDASMLRSRSCL